MISPLKSTDTKFQRLERLSPLGYFAMGIGWIRVATRPGKNVKMLAIANGSDWTPQPLTLHAPHPERSFEKLPCWFSDDYDHHMGLAIGDVTGNGYDDVVVAVFAGKDQRLTGGGVKMYPGGPEGLSPQPIWLSQGYAATGVALADITGDGTLDILVSCLTEQGTIQAPHTNSNGHFEGRARLLVNQGTSNGLSTTFHPYVIERTEARGAGDVTVADVDLDGTLDVVFAGRRTAVLYGNP
jgi:hypothetical protein